MSDSILHVKLRFRLLDVGDVPLRQAASISRAVASTWEDLTDADLEVFLPPAPLNLYPTDPYWYGLDLEYRVRAWLRLSRKIAGYIEIHGDFFMENWKTYFEEFLIDDLFASGFEKKDWRPTDARLVSDHILVGASYHEVWYPKSEMYSNYCFDCGRPLNAFSVRTRGYCSTFPYYHRLQNKYQRKDLEPGGYCGYHWLLNYVMKDEYSEHKQERERGGQLPTDLSRFTTERISHHHITNQNAVMRWWLSERERRTDRYTRWYNATMERLREESKRNRLHRSDKAISRRMVPVD